MRTLSPEAIAYAWRQLARLAGVADPGRAPGTGFESIGVSVHYAPPETVTPRGPTLIVTPCQDGAWEELLRAAPGSLAPVPGLPSEVPALMWGRAAAAGSQPFASLRDDGALVVHVDIISAVLFMLTRWEETARDDHDEHGRFRASHSVADRHGFIDQPIIDLYGGFLGTHLSRDLLPGWKQTPRRFEVLLSHDIDDLHRFRSLGQGIRRVGGDLLKRRNPGEAVDNMTAILHPVVAPRRAAEYRGIFELAELSTSSGVRSAFYFMSADRSPLDTGYDPTSPMLREAIEFVRKSGHEVGLHPGYETFDNPTLLAREKARLDAVLGETRYGGRQHFLRFAPPRTWRHWEQVGLTYDSTLGFIDREGFRCGTCHPYRPFDLEENRELDLLEIPLIANDATLRRYRELSPGESLRIIQTLARRCADVGGTFTLLWHNSSLTGVWRTWAPMYRQAVRWLAELGG
jgi:hypothetical protein